MPGTLVQMGAMISCAHQGMAQVASVSPRVKLMGQPLAVLGPAPATVAGCALPPPPNGNGPCVTGTWSTSALRVKSMGLPALLMDSQALCAPTGTPLMVKLTQLRVKGQ